MQVVRATIAAQNSRSKYCQFSSTSTITQRSKSHPVVNLAAFQLRAYEREARARQIA